MAFQGKPNASNEAPVWDGTKYVAQNIATGVSGVISSSNFNFRPTAADFGTPLIFNGSVVSASLMDIVAGDTPILATTYNILSMSLIPESPASSSVLIFPITIPGSINGGSLPEKFRMNYGLIAGNAPQDGHSFQIGPVMYDTDFSASLWMKTEVTGASAFIDTISIVSTLTGSTEHTYDSTEAEWGGFYATTLDFESVQPFNATQTQIQMNLQANSLDKDLYYNGKFISSFPSTGSLGGPDFGGKVLNKLGILVTTQSDHTHNVGPSFWINIETHPDDRDGISTVVSSSTKDISMSFNENNETTTAKNVGFIYLEQGTIEPAVVYMGDLLASGSVVLDLIYPDAPTVPVSTWEVSGALKEVSNASVTIPSSSWYGLSLYASSSSTTAALKGIQWTWTP